MGLPAGTLGFLWLASVAYGQDCDAPAWSKDFWYERPRLTSPGVNWLCGVRIEVSQPLQTPRVRPSQPTGFLSNVTDPTTCLQICAARNTPGSPTVCNAVSLPYPIQGYQGCHLLLVSPSSYPLSTDPGYRSIYFEPECIPDAAAAAAICNPCDTDCAPPPVPESPHYNDCVYFVTDETYERKDLVDFGQVELGTTAKIGLGFPSLSCPELYKIRKIGPRAEGFYCIAGAAASYLFFELPDTNGYSSYNASCRLYNGFVGTEYLGGPSSIGLWSIFFRPEVPVELDATVTFADQRGAIVTIRVLGTGGDPSSVPSPAPTPALPSPAIPSAPPSAGPQCPCPSPVPEMPMPGAPAPDPTAIPGPSPTPVAPVPNPGYGYGDDGYGYGEIDED